MAIKNRLAMATLLTVVAMSGASNAQTVEYLVKNVDLNFNTSYESGPDIKTKSSQRCILVLTSKSVHNYPRGIVFLVFSLKGYDKDEKPLALNPAVDNPAGRDKLPLYAQSDAVVAATFFEKPWLAGRESEFTVEIPVSVRFPFAGSGGTLSYSTYAVGHEAKDAVPLLGDPVLSQNVRESISLWLSQTAGKRYLYLTDDGRWVLPGKVDETLPRATEQEHVTANNVKFSGPVEHGSEIRVRNATQTTKVLRVAGFGREQWYKVGSQKQAIIEVDAGLVAITIMINEQHYATQTVLIRPQAGYTLDLE